jgi:hypothetical protein
MCLFGQLSSNNFMMKSCRQIWKYHDVCNIPGCEARNRENTEVCIAFIHPKIRRIFALLIKTVKEIEVSLVSMGIELVIDMSAINFDMIFVDFLKLRRNYLNS